MAVETAPGTNVPVQSTAAIIQRGIKRRYAAERRFKLYGIAAILFGLFFLCYLFGSIVSQGYTAFVQTSWKLNVFLDPKVIDPSGKLDEKSI